MSFKSRVSIPIYVGYNAILLWLSVCLSDRHTPVLYRNECTYRQTLSIFW